MSGSNPITRRPFLTEQAPVKTLTEDPAAAQQIADAMAKSTDSRTREAAGYYDSMKTEMPNLPTDRVVTMLLDYRKAAHGDKLAARNLERFRQHPPASEQELARQSRRHLDDTTYLRSGAPALWRYGQ